MKKVIVLLFAAITLLLSCNNKESQKPISCSKKADGNLDMKIIGQTSFSFKCDYWLVKQDYDNINSLLAYTNNELYTFIKNNFKTKIELLNQNNIYSIVLYINKSINSSSVINIKSIKGISIYEYSDNSIYHHLFLRSKNVFVEKKVTNVEVAGVSSNQIRHNLKNYLFKDVNDKSYLIVFTNDAKQFNNIIGTPKINYQTEIKGFNTKEPDGGSVNCGAECNSGNNMMTCMANIGGWKCQANGGPLDPCSANQTYLILDGYNEQTLIDFQLMYNFRDNFLSKTNFGNTYIDHYYYISSIVDSKLTLSIAIETAQTPRYRTIVSCGM